MDKQDAPAPSRPASVTAALSMCREAKVEATIPAQMAWDLAQYVRQLEVIAQAEPAAWANQDELDNMLNDRGAMVAGIRDGWRKTPLYLHPRGAQPAPEYMRGPRGVCVQVVGIDTGEE